MIDYREELERRYGFDRGDGKITRDKNGKLVIPDGGRAYGYARVSTKNQKEWRQFDSLIDYGVPPENIFVEKMSGKDFERPVYKQMLRTLRPGDLLVITTVDRLGRNYKEVVEQWRSITRDRMCGIHVIEMPTLNISGDKDDVLSAFMVDIILQTLSYTAEAERTQMLRRQSQGYNAKKRREKAEYDGGYVNQVWPEGWMEGKRSIIRPEMWYYYKMWRKGEMRRSDVVKLASESLGISIRSVYRAIRELHSRFDDIKPEDLDSYMMSHYKLGFKYDTERVDHALGQYSSYNDNPVKLRAKRDIARAKFLRGETDSPTRGRKPKVVQDDEEREDAINEARLDRLIEKVGIPKENIYIDKPRSDKKKKRRGTSPIPKDELEKSINQAVSNIIVEENLDDD